MIGDIFTKLEKEKFFIDLMRILILSQVFLPLPFKKNDHKK